MDDPQGPETQSDATANGLTLMAVHAHPDDEAIGTGGVLARYSAEGVRTVLVTCTNGEQGDALGGVKPGEDGHHPEEVAAVRLAELRTSAAQLGVGHLELLGYRDSGMDGWAANQDPGVFCNVPLPDASARLAELMRHYRPQVVVTYDENGNYGHPDHIQAHRAAVAAAESTGIPDKLYYLAVPRSGIAQIRQMLEASGQGTGAFDVPEDFGVPDEKITTVVDVSPYVRQKREALAAHASQNQNFFFESMPEEVVAVVLSRECFTLRSAADGQVQEDDLFAGLREESMRDA
jgi:LmbE family N-acetylglucosaminyl deacetylase